MPKTYLFLVLAIVAETIGTVPLPRPGATHHLCHEGSAQGNCQLRRSLAAAGISGPCRLGAGRINPR